MKNTKQLDIDFLNSFSFSKPKLFRKSISNLYNKKNYADILPFFSLVNKSYVARITTNTEQNIQNRLENNLRLFNNTYKNTNQDKEKDTTLESLNFYLNTLLLKPEHRLPTNPQISIIVPTFNGNESILKTLQSLRLQTIDHDNYEIIIVDDGSTNDNANVIKKFISKNKRLKITFIELSKNTGPSMTRNIGVMYSSGNLLCFTDDDCIVPEDWLSNFIDILGKNPEVAAAGGWYYTYDNARETIYDKYLYYKSLPNAAQNTKSMRIRGNACGNTANLCVRKEAFAAVGGFNPFFRFPGFDDWEFKIRLHLYNFSLLNNDKMVIHLKRHTFNSFIKMSIFRGWGRHCVYSIYNIDPNYYKVTFWNTLKIIYYSTKKLISNSNDFTLKERFMFMFLIPINYFTNWIGRYWIPFFVLKKSFNK